MLKMTEMVHIILKNIAVRTNTITAAIGLDDFGILSVIMVRNTVKERRIVIE